MNESLYEDLILVNDEITHKLQHEAETKCTEGLVGLVSFNSLHMIPGDK